MAKRKTKSKLRFPDPPCTPKPPKAPKPPRPTDPGWCKTGTGADDLLKLVKKLGK
jgi:hypothetical protein